MNEVQELDTGQNEPSHNPNRSYVIVAVVLLVVIIIAAVLLIAFGIPALKGAKEPTATTEAEPEPTHTPPPPTLPPLEMQYTETPEFEYESAGVRPGIEWTGFFGQVLDADGNPVPGVIVIIWDDVGKPVSDPTPTDQDGNYQIVLAEAPLEGTWNIQLLTEDRQPASNPFGIQTDTDTETGIQQIQIIWKQVP